MIGIGTALIFTAGLTAGVCIGVYLREKEVVTCDDIERGYDFLVDSSKALYRSVTSGSPRASSPLTSPGPLPTTA